GLVYRAAEGRATRKQFAAISAALVFSGRAAHIALHRGAAMKKAPAVRLALLAVLVAAGAAAAWLLRDRFSPALEWVHGLGFWGLVVLAAAYVPAALFSLPPASLLTVAAGAF